MVKKVKEDQEAKRKPGRPTKQKLIPENEYKGILEFPENNEENIIEFNHGDPILIKSIFVSFKSSKCNKIYMRFLHDVIIFYGFTSKFDENKDENKNCSNTLIATFSASKMYKYYCKDPCEIIINEPNVSLYKIMTTLNTNFASILFTINNISYNI